MTRPTGAGETGDAVGVGVAQRAAMLTNWNAAAAKIANNSTPRAIVVPGRMHRSSRTAPGYTQARVVPYTEAPAVTTPARG